MRTENDGQDIIAGINVTPLVDITLVLLIVFMVSATFVSEQGLKVALPEVTARENVPAPALTLAVGVDGRLKLMGKDVTLEELKNRLALEARLDSNVKILVKADRDLPYSKVAEVLDSVKSAGIGQAALATEPR